ncbi:MAG: type II secretion system inner membrane protein GspF [Maricaulaceae bacterium]
MATFDYVALDPAGRQRRGVVSADTPKGARQTLKRQKLTPLKLTPASGGGAAGVGALSGLAGFWARARASKLSAKSVVVFTRQLAMLIRAGAPVEEALSAVAAQADTATARKTVFAVRGAVTEGRSLSDALARENAAFRGLYRAMVAAGEASGDLGYVLEQLADYLEKRQAMARKIQAALIYPAVLGLVAMSIVTALMVFVVPRVVEQFDTLGQDLPALTQVMIAISAFLRGYGLILLLGLAAGGVAFAQALRRKPVKRRVDQVLLRVPLIGKALRDVMAARFARTFATLLGGGATVLDALGAARGVLGNLVAQEAVDAMIGSVREGGSMGAAMRKTDVFPPLLVHLTVSGERSGELAAMMGKGADYLESEFETSTGLALSLLEPGIIVVMGGLVASIVLAIMLPILRLNSLAVL